MIFLIIILIFMFMFVSFFVLFAYLYAYVPFGVLNLSKKLSVRISFFIFYAIFTLLVIFFGFNASSVIVVPIMILSILILRRKGYFTNFTKARVAMAGACLLVFTWQLEVPQTIIVNLLPVKLEIVNDDFEYVENPVQRFSAFIESNLDFEEEKTKRFLNFTYSKMNIYACDDFDCKGDKKYVGFYWDPWSDASTLECINGVSTSCMRSINRNKRGRDYLMSFIENKKQKNKGKNNE